MKANGIHPSCDKPASPSTPKEKSRAAIARSAAAKRRKIEGDTYDTKQDDEDEEEMKPMILKNERNENDRHRQVKSEPDPEFRGTAYPHISVPPSPPYFPHLSQPIMHSPGFHHISSQQPIQQQFHHSPIGSNMNQQFRYYPTPNMLPMRPQYPIPSVPSPQSIPVGVPIEPERQSSSWLNEFYKEDFTKGLTNFETASCLPSMTKTEAQIEESRPRSMASPSSVMPPLGPQQVVPKTDGSIPNDIRSIQVPADESSSHDLSGNIMMAGQGIENSILIAD